jgi:sugar-specific transcriptional regulator TrmB
MQISKNEKTKQNESLSMKHLKDLTDMAKMNLKDYINNLCFQLAKYKVDKTKEIENWKNDFLKKVNTDIDNLNILISDNKKQDNLNENNNNIKKEYKIESSNELNIFTSKDIQEENKEITRNFQNETYNYMNVNEKIENENVALFLKEVARLSRISYNNKNLLFKLMKDKYIQIKGNISFNDENSKKEFSSWVKKFEKENGNKEYLNILNQIKLFENNNTNQKYLEKLFYDLTIMYFHCDLSFPSIQINFKKENDFISEKMIDFINRGKNRKVNFIILPSLFSNGNYLQNGKSWVFTYYKNTFKFDDTINDTLNKLLEKEYKNTNTNSTKTIKNIKDILKMNVICKNKSQGKEITVFTNYEIPKNLKYEYIFVFKNNITNKISDFATNKKSFVINNYFDIVEYRLKLENEIIIKSNKIISKF